MSSLILLDAVGNVVSLLPLHELLIAVVDLIAHLVHNFLHACVAGSNLLYPHLLLPLSSLHLVLNGLSFHFLKVLVGDSPLLTVFLIVFYHFESSSLINVFLLG